MLGVQSVRNASDAGPVGVIGTALVGPTDPSVRSLEGPGPTQRRLNRKWLRLLLAVGLGAVVTGGGYWWTHRAPALPAGFAYGNGRFEADPIDIATKFPGRIAELRVDEGDTVIAGQPLAVMDTRDLAQSLAKASAEVRLQQRSIAGAEAGLEQIRSQRVLAEQQMERAASLLKNGWTTREIFDQRHQQLDAARAAERVAGARVSQLQNALQVAAYDVELLKVNIADNTLVAPRNGRIEYRIANVGEILPAGGKVFSMLDVGYLYMDIYLPTLIVGLLQVGDEARILLDAYPAAALRARVSFISSRAQFTPKMVETKTERDKLMFRVRIRVDVDQLHKTAAHAPVGLPGMAYVRFKADAVWPLALQGTP